MKKKRKKIVKLRGSKTHGYGSKKKHRGGGSKGGRGRAGSFKHKKVLMRKLGLIENKRGFVSLKKKGIKPEVRAINLKDIVKIAKDKKEIDLKELGFDKVLGKGNLEKPITIKARFFSNKAKEKIEAAGGKAIEIEKESLKE